MTQRLYESPRMNILFCSISFLPLSHSCGTDRCSMDSEIHLQVDATLIP